MSFKALLMILFAPVARLLDRFENSRYIPFRSMSSIIYGCDSNFDPHVAISDTFKTKLKGVEKRSRKSPQGTGRAEG